MRADGEKLVGLFPGILRDEGGVWLSDSADGVHWSRPLRLMEVPIHRGADNSARTALHSVSGFSASADGAVHFEVDHRINLDHTCGINGPSAKPKPMHAPELLCDPATTLDHLTCRGAKLYLPKPLCEPEDYPYTCSYTYSPETPPAAQPAAAQPAAAQPAAASPASSVSEKPCRLLCESSSFPWEKKCTWGLSCSGCSQCDESPQVQVALSRAVGAVGTDDAQPASWYPSSALALSAAGTWGIAYL